MRSCLVSLIIVQSLNEPKCAMEQYEGDLLKELKKKDKNMHKMTKNLKVLKASCHNRGSTT